MGDIPGMIKPDLRALPTIKERMTFLYVERCLVSRQDSAVSITDARGTAYAPAASLGVLMLGPGTNISHRAVELLGDSGASVIWVGEHGVRYYAHGRSPPIHLDWLSRRLNSCRTLESVSPWRERCMACAFPAKTYRITRCSNSVAVRELGFEHSIGGCRSNMTFHGRGGNTTPTIFSTQVQSIRRCRLLMYAFTELFIA